MMNLVALVAVALAFTEADPSAAARQVKACGTIEGAILSPVSDPLALGQDAVRDGRLEAAVSAFRTALLEAERYYGPHHAVTSTALIELAGALSAGGQYAEAVTLLERAVDIEERSLCGGGPAEAAQALEALNAILRRSGS